MLEITSETHLKQNSDWILAVLLPLDGFRFAADTPSMMEDMT